MERKWMRAGWFFLTIVALTAGNFGAFAAPPSAPSAGALRVWDEYQRLTERRINSEISSGRGFLVQDFFSPEEQARCKRTLDSGSVYVTKMQTRADSGASIEPPDALVHHWMGSIFVPSITLASLLKWVQNYDQQAKYFNEVEASKTLSRTGDTFKIYLRLRRKKIITVYYNTEHWAEYRSWGPTRVASRSYATKIAELADPGTPREREKPSQDDSGFLWKLNSYWRFQQEHGGVTVDCESISLSRRIPTGLGWLIRGYVESVPRESLTTTLISLRDGVHGRTK